MVETVELAEVPGVRCLPDSPSGVGALVLAGSSGRVDADRAALLAAHGVLAESIQWFGGPGQQPGPWEVPLEPFLDRVRGLARECDRVIVLGTSFGAEAALLTGAHCAEVDAVVAFAPTDVVWAGVRDDGTMTSHWALDGVPLPWVPFDDEWHPDSDPPAFVGCYLASRRRYGDLLDAARIPVDRVPNLVLVAGGDDQVWPALAMAETIQEHRTALGLPTVLVSDPDAGHRTVLPGEPIVAAGQRMRRGGSEPADRRLGAAAWNAIRPLLGL